MALSKFEKDIGYVSKLDDQPNDVGGLSADELKGVFDMAALELQNYINKSLIPEIESDIDAAAQGITPGGGIDGARISDNSISDPKIIGLDGSKISDRSLTTDKHVKASITRELLAEDAKTLQTEDFPNKVVPNRALADKVVTTVKIEDAAVTAEKIANNAVSQTFTATIPADEWTGSAAPYIAEVSVNGILSSDTPDVDLVASDSFADAEPQLEAWGYIYKAVTKDGAITFYATEKPEVELPIQIKAVRK